MILKENRCKLQCHGTRNESTLPDHSVNHILTMGQPSHIVFGCFLGLVLFFCHLMLSVSVFSITSTNRELLRKERGTLFYYNLPGGFAKMTIEWAVFCTNTLSSEVFDLKTRVTHSTVTVQYRTVQLAKNLLKT